MVRPPLYSADGIGALSAAAAGARLRAGSPLSIPNLITLSRILLVPIVVWAIWSGAMWVAFVLFLAAGVSDAVDGFLAKRFHMTTVIVAPLVECGFGDLLFTFTGGLADFAHVGQQSPLFQ